MLQIVPCHSFIPFSRYGCPICSLTWVGLPYIWQSSFSTQPIPSSHLPNHNRADKCTTKNTVNSTQIRKQMCPCDFNEMEMIKLTINYTLNHRFEPWTEVTSTLQKLRTNVEWWWKSLLLLYDGICLPNNTGLEESESNRINNFALSWGWCEKQEGNGPIHLRWQGLWEIGMWCCMTSITPVNTYTGLD